MTSVCIIVLAYFTVGVIGDPPLTKLSTGVHLEHLTKTFYTASANAIFELEIPDLSVNFLTNYTCSGTDCEFHNHIKKLINDTLVHLNHTLPAEDDLPVYRKVRRGLNFLGDVGHWCCSLATQSEIDTLTQKESDMLQLISNLKRQIATEHDDAVQSKTLMNQYSQDMHYTVENVIIEANKSIYGIAKMADDLYYNVLNLESSVSVLAKLAHKTVLSLLWSKVLSDCTAHKIPHALVTADILSQDLKTLASNLRKHNQSLAISEDKPHNYYSLKTTKCYFSERKLIIRVQVPILPSNVKFELYAVQPLPFHFNGSICQLSLNTDYVIFKNKKELIPLLGHARAKCIPIQEQMCFISRYNTAPPDKKCIDEALLNHRAIGDLKAACHFTCSKTDLSQPSIIQFSSNKFGILMLPGEIMIKCINKTDQSHSIMHQEGMYELTLPCHCAAFISNLEEPLEPDWPCNIMHNEVVVRHVLPAAWTMTLEQTILSPHSYFSNATTIINPSWPKQIPNVHLSSLPPAEYTLPEHVQASSYVTYAVSLIVFIVIIIIIYLVVQAGGTSAAIATLMSHFTQPASAFPLENSPATDLFFESFQLLCLCVLTLMVILIYLKLRTSPFLNFLNSRPVWTKGRHKLQFLDENNPDSPAISMESSFQNPRNKASLGMEMKTFRQH